VLAAKIRCPVDYAIPTFPLYVSFAKAALRSANPIDILHCAGAFPSTGQQGASALPSWVPDWRTPRLYQPLMKATQFKAGISNLNRRIAVVIDEVANTIVVPAIRVGLVKSDTLPFPNYIGRSIAVGYVRSGALDMSVDRECVYVDTPSQKGVVGCAPSVTKEGDIVVVFATARTPFILRQNTPSSFELVCDCYLQGFMHGEAFSGGREFEDVVIV
jgi:hypothetical protein